jgi:cell division protein FtsZ
MFELVDTQHDSAVIKVIGIGGGGGNAVEHMVVENVEGVQFICANTDAQALKNSKAKYHLQLGEELTKGLGAGADPDIGRKAAEEDKEKIKEVLMGADMVFITAGMGGGTGTGAAPVVAEVAKEMGILTVAVVTKPFSFEGKQRAISAETGIQQLSEHVDSLITIPNNKLLSVLGKNISLINAFKAANNVLLGAVQGIADLITRPGLINVDFADVRTVMSEMGMAMMGTGHASGDDRARKSAEAAIASPLLEDVDFAGAKGILVNITAGLDMSIGEFEEVGDVIKGFISDDATVVVGTVIDPELNDELRVTVIVTGLGQEIGGNNTVRFVETSKKDGTLDYQQLDKPAVIRKQAAVASAPTSKPAVAGTGTGTDVEYLDIPAFLRRQEEN